MRLGLRSNFKLMKGIVVKYQDCRLSTCAIAVKKWPCLMFRKGGRYARIAYVIDKDFVYTFSSTFYHLCFQNWDSRYVASHDTAVDGELPGLSPSSTALASCFLLWNKSVPRQGAKNILPVIDRCAVPAATTNHVRTHAPVSTFSIRNGR